MNENLKLIHDIIDESYFSPEKEKVISLFNKYGIFNVILQVSENL